MPLAPPPIIHGNAVSNNLLELLSPVLGEEIHAGENEHQHEGNDDDCPNNLQPGDKHDQRAAVAAVAPRNEQAILPHQA